MRACERFAALSAVQPSWMRASFRDCLRRGGGIVAVSCEF